MKKLICLLMAAAFLVVAKPTKAQFRDIPAAVTSAMKEKYPNATEISWDDKVSYFQAKFLLDGKRQEARFKKDGTWEVTEKAILFDEMPSAVQEAFNASEYKKWTLRTVAALENSQGGKEYRVYVRNNTVQRKYLYYGEDGKLLRESYKL
jgi:hypothetical protein